MDGTRLAASWLISAAAAAPQSAHPCSGSRQPAKCSLALEPGAAARLHAACANDDLAAAEALLEETGGSLVNARDVDGRTPLHIVTSFCGFDIDTAAFVHLLCEWGADPSARDAAGQTPLMLAVREVGYGWHSPEATATLLAHGADPRAADAEGRTPLHHVGAGAADGCLYSPGEGPGLSEDVLKIRSVVQQLLHAGADSAVRDAAGLTPMDLALATSNACATLALLMEGVPLERLLPPRLACLMGEVMRGAQAHSIAAAAAAAAAQAEAAALRRRIAQMESEQLANMGPALRSLIIRLAGEVRRLDHARAAAAAPAAVATAAAAAVPLAAEAPMAAAASAPPAP